MVVSDGLLIYGAGGHAISVADTALSMGYALKGFVEDTPRADELLGYPIYNSLDIPVECESMAIAVGDNYGRAELYRRIKREFSHFSFPVLIHRSSYVSKFSSIGEGSVIMGNAFIGPSCDIGHFCIVNSAASLDHGSSMGSFSSLAPGAVTGGGVVIGRSSAICLGATLSHGVNIGDSVVIGGNSFVNRDIESNQVAFGSPCRAQYLREDNSPYL